MDLIIQILAVSSVLFCFFMAAYSYRKEAKREKLAYLNARSEVANMFNRLELRVNDMQAEKEVDNLYDYRLPAMNAPRGGIQWEQPRSDPATADMDQLGKDDDLLEDLYRQAMIAMHDYNERLVRREMINANLISRPQRITYSSPIPPYTSSDL